MNDILKCFVISFIIVFSFNLVYSIPTERTNNTNDTSSVTDIPAILPFTLKKDNSTVKIPDTAATDALILNVENQLNTDKPVAEALKSVKSESSNEKKSEKKVLKRLNLIPVLVPLFN